MKARASRTDVSFRGNGAQGKLPGVVCAGKVSRLRQLAALLAGVWASLWFTTPPAVAQDQAYTAVLGCDPQAGHVCFCTLFDEAAVPRAHFALRASEHRLISITDNQHYIYVITLDADFSSDPTCRTAQAQGVSCKEAALKEGYND